jgi:hypothetical protein
VLVRFSDAHQTESVKISLSGCRFVTNGTNAFVPDMTWDMFVASISTAACPSVFEPKFLPPVIEWPGLDATVVPITATSVLVCRYDNTPPSGRLVSFGVVTDGKLVRELETVSNGLRHANPNNDAAFCPLVKRNPSWSVYFAGPSYGVALRYPEGGCLYVSNGTLRAVATRQWEQLLDPVATLPVLPLGPPYRPFGT